MIYANFGHNAMNYETNTRLVVDVRQPDPEPVLIDALKWLGGAGTPPPADQPSPDRVVLDRQQGQRKVRRRPRRRDDATKVIDVTNVSSADNAGLQLWTYGGGSNQQWKAVPEGDGHFRFVSRLSNKCLTVPNASTADSIQLVQLTCNGNSAQSFRLTAM